MRRLAKVWAAAPVAAPAATSAAGSAVASAAAWGAALLLSAGAASAQPHIGRLFNSEAERLTLDINRNKALAAPQNAGAGLLTGSAPGFSAATRSNAAINATTNAATNGGAQGTAAAALLAGAPAPACCHPRGHRRPGRP